MGDIPIPTSHLEYPPFFCKVRVLHSNQTASRFFRQECGISPYISLYRDPTAAVSSRVYFSDIPCYWLPPFLHIFREAKERLPLACLMIGRAGDPLLRFLLFTHQLIIRLCHCLFSIISAFGFKILYKLIKSICCKTDVEVQVAGHIVEEGNVPREYLIQQIQAMNADQPLLVNMAEGNMHRDAPRLVATQNTVVYSDASWNVATNGESARSESSRLRI